MDSVSLVVASNWLKQTLESLSAVLINCFISTLHCRILYILGNNLSYDTFNIKEKFG